MIRPLFVLLAASFASGLRLAPARLGRPVALATEAEPQSEEQAPLPAQKRLVPLTNQPWLDEIFDTPPERAERDARKRANVMAWGQYLNGKGPDPKTLQDQLDRGIAPSATDHDGAAPSPQPFGGLPPIFTIVGVPLLLVASAVAESQLAALR